MPGRSSDSSLGRAVGGLAALVAVGLFALERFTGLSVPYGYGGDAFLLGFAVAAVAILVVAWGYRDAFLP